MGGRCVCFGDRRWFSAGKGLRKFTERQGDRESGPSYLCRGFEVCFNIAAGRQRAPSCCGLAVQGGEEIQQGLRSEGLRAEMSSALALVPCVRGIRHATC